jgi:hypothetical protein
LFTLIGWAEHLPQFPRRPFLWTAKHRRALPDYFRIADHPLIAIGEACFSERDESDRRCGGGHVKHGVRRIWGKRITGWQEAVGIPKHLEAILAADSHDASKFPLPNIDLTNYAWLATEYRQLIRNE